MNKMMKRYVIIAISLLTVFSCSNKKSTSPASNSSARITFTYQPNPVTAGEEYTWEISITEHDNVGVTLSYIRENYYNDEGDVVLSLEADSDDIVSLFGTNNLPALGTISDTGRASFNISLCGCYGFMEIGGTDANGNNVTSSVRIDIAACTGKR